MHHGRGLLAAAQSNTALGEKLLSFGGKFVFCRQLLARGRDKSLWNLHARPWRQLAAVSHPADLMLDTIIGRADELVRDTGWRGSEEMNSVR